MASPAPGNRTGQRVHEIVLTGGPCAGKTTGMDHLAQHLRSTGHRVLVVPEAATMFISGGISDIADIAADPARYARFQRALVSTQASLRDRYRSMAAALGDRSVVILYDRAECDAAAYVDPTWFGAVLASDGRSLIETRDSYDAVIHLTSAAVGAEEHYTNANNTARSETLDQARALDAATLAAWVGHPRLAVIANHGTFADKLDRLVTVVESVLGQPAPLEIERKYLLDGPADLDHPSLDHAVAIGISQTYLVADPATPAAERRVRAYTQGGATRHVLTTKERIGPATRIEHEVELDPLTYVELLAQADPARRPVTKTRHCFVWNHQVFVLDEVHAPQPCWLLEIELVDEAETVEVPDFLGPVTDVTEDPAWSAATLAAR